MQLLLTITIAIQRGFVGGVQGLGFPWTVQGLGFHRRNHVVRQVRRRICRYYRYDANMPPGPVLNKLHKLISSAWNTAFSNEAIDMLTLPCGLSGPQLLLTFQEQEGWDSKSLGRITLHIECINEGCRISTNTPKKGGCASSDFLQSCPLKIIL